MEGRILVIGESLVDVILRDGRPPEVLPGGSPLNVAVGLQRLGITTMFHSRFGFDAFGSAIASHLAGDGVHIVTGTQDSFATSVAQATIQPNGSADYSFDVEWAIAPLVDIPADIIAVHTGSIGAVLEPGAHEVEREIDAARLWATVSYDPNIRPQLMTDHAAILKRVERLVQKADIVKASDEDIEWLYPGVEPMEAAIHWLVSGPSMVVITRGALGSIAATRAGMVMVDAVVTEVVDTVGAGDSFMSGLLSALADRALLGRERAQLLRSIDKDAAHAVLRFASECAAVTVSRRAADPPYREEMQER